MADDRQPNGYTRMAVTHPLRYSVLTFFMGLVIAGFAAVGGSPGVFLYVGLPLAVLLGLGNFVLWRPGGLGERWARRRFPDATF